MLEGGGWKGLYTLGVLDCLMMNDINFTSAAGCSAGALSAIGYVSGQIGWLTSSEKWSGINGIGMIISTVQTSETTSTQKHYFIYSCKGLTAAEIMAAKRAHWSIENSLHCVLDMTFREDESRARKDNSAENFNVLRQMAYNILKLDKTTKGGLTDKQFRCALDQNYFEKIIRLWVCS